MLDTDCDGVLNPTDLLKSFELISMDSKFGKELHRLMFWFTETNIKQAQNSTKEKPTVNINYDIFLSLLPNTMHKSLAVTEITRRCMGKPK